MIFYVVGPNFENYDNYNTEEPLNVDAKKSDYNTS